MHLMPLGHAIHGGSGHGAIHLERNRSGRWVERQGAWIKRVAIKLFTGFHQILLVESASEELLLPKRIGVPAFRLRNSFQR
jgi:hypothetical protein